MSPSDYPRLSRPINFNTKLFKLNEFIFWRFINHPKVEALLYGTHPWRDFGGNTRLGPRKCILQTRQMKDRTGERIGQAITHADVMEGLRYIKFYEPPPDGCDPDLHLELAVDSYIEQIVPDSSEYQDLLHAVSAINQINIEKRTRLRMKKKEETRSRRLRTRRITLSKVKTLMSALASDFGGPMRDVILAYVVTVNHHTCDFATIPVIYYVGGTNVDRVMNSVMAEAVLRPSGFLRSKKKRAALADDIFAQLRLYARFHFEQMLLRSNREFRLEMIPGEHRRVVAKDKDENGFWEDGNTTVGIPMGRSRRYGINEMGLHD